MYQKRATDTFFQLSVKGELKTYSRNIDACSRDISGFQILAFLLPKTKAKHIAEALRQIFISKIFYKIDIE